MLNKSVYLLMGGLLTVGSVSPVPAWSVDGLYEIRSGAYIVVGGIWGSLTNRLPSSGQAFVRITSGLGSGSVEVQILGEDVQTEHERFTNGTMVGNQILFRYPTVHPDYPLINEPMLLDYTVTLGDGSLWLEGSIEAEHVICCDIPWQFTHQGVQATLVSPRLEITARNPAELSLQGIVGRSYRIEAANELADTNVWQSLATITLSEKRASWTDTNAAPYPNRFYRAALLPALSDRVMETPNSARVAN